MVKCSIAIILLLLSVAHCIFAQEACNITPKTNQQTTDLLSTLKDGLTMEEFHVR